VPDFSKGTYLNSLRPVLDFKGDLNSETLELSWINPNEDNYTIIEDMNYFDVTNCLPYSSSDSSISTISFANNHSELIVNFSERGSWHDAGVKILCSQHYVDELSFNIKGDGKKLRLTI
jgi:hypothetical protein